MRFPRTIALTFAIPSLVAVCLALAGASHSEAAQSAVTVAEACAPDGTASLYFGWRASGPSANELWLDVGTDNDWRSFASAGPLDPTARSYEWPGFTAGATYYVRLNELRADQTWDSGRTVSYTTFSCDGNSAYPSTGATTAAGASAKPSVSATGYAPAEGLSANGSISATGYGPPSGSLSATSYVSSSGIPTSGSDSAPSYAVTRPPAPPMNSVTYFTPHPTFFIPPAGAASTGSMTFIPFAGNGGGPTLCNDGLYSNSSGSGTCSGHGGEAH